ncbi:MAG TPA: hypothetical protein VFA50_10500 [Stellaceae bacterium]|nr:hypothetical protein [Stellaceae bacterium]
MRHKAAKVARLPVIGPAIIDLARSLRDPETERAVRADLRQTAQELAWLRAALPEPTLAAKRLLIVSLSDMVYQLKIEAMLGAALKLAGWRPIILTNARANTRARRYFAAFGIADFLYLEDFAPTAEEAAEAEAEAARLLAGAPSFQAVKAWTFGGSWIGPQILSTVSRRRLEGAPDPAEEATRGEIATLLPQVLRRVRAAERVVAAARADLGLVIEANYTVYGPFVDRLIAGGIAVIQVTQPWRDDALIFKRLTRETRRMHPSSVSPESFAAVLRRPWGMAEERAVDEILAARYSGKWYLQRRNQPDTEDADPGALKRMLALDPGKKIATVFSHVLWDANLFYGEDLFEDYGEWFIETVRAAARNPALSWLIKLHPANLWKRARDGATGEYSELSLIRRRLGALPPHVRLLLPDTRISTASLFAASDFGVTVRGTCGMELPCFGKATLTAGTGRYSGLGFTVDSSSRAEYLGRLARLQDAPPMTPQLVLRARRHAHAAFILRPWSMSSFRSVFQRRERGVGALDQNLATVARSVAELRANGDLHRFAVWAAGNDIDYLEL